MSHEQFGHFEKQPASRDSIRRTLSILDILTKRPPRSIDVDETMEMLISQVSVSDQSRGRLAGERSAFYAIKGNENEAGQQLYVTLAPEDIHDSLETLDIPVAYLAVIRYENIEGNVELAQNKYKIYADRIAWHREVIQPSDDMQEDTFAHAKIERMDEEYGIPLMTEGGLIKLNASLGALIED